MKIPGIAAFVLIATLATATSGQVKSVAAANNQPASSTASPAQNPPNTTRARVLGSDPKTNGNTAGTARLQAPVKSEFNNHPEITRLRATNAPSGAPAIKPSPSTPTTTPTSASRRGSLASARTGHTSLKPANVAKTTTTTTTTTTTAASTSPAPAVSNVTPTAIAAVATSVYRVGIRDVLDIQLSDNPSRNSTLFTVLDSGLLEYPFAGGPLPVAGLTTAEIATLLRQRIKIFDNPAVTVSVRDYASHSLTISGFVAAPGTKNLRRDAVPLYTILAEASVLPEAARATITRPGRAPIVVDLKDANLSATLVVPGDVIKVTGPPAGPTEFFFIGGEINSPGQKPYNAGLTLTQAILASGGTNASAGSKVRVSRQGADGLLATEEYNLRKILNGKLPDPVLQKGDRIEVTVAN